MPKGFARVAAVSLRVHLGDVKANEQEILNAMDALAAKGVQAAVFPELCLTGYTLGDLILREEVQKAAWEGMLRIAQKTGDMAVMVGLPVDVRGRLYNCAAVLQCGKVQGLVPKSFLANGSEFYETRWFQNGANAFEQIRIGDELVELSPCQLFDMGSFVFGVETCEDLWTPVPPSARLATEGADILFNLSASNALVGKHDYRRTMLKQHSSRLHAGYVYASAGFGESTSDVVFDGCTGVYEDGDVLAEGERFCMNGGMAVADVDIQRLRYHRRRTGSFHQLFGSDKQAAIRMETLSPALEAPLPLLRDIEPLPFVPKTDEGLEEIARIQCTGLASRLVAIRCQNLVIGVSGGLDSTLALLVAARTFDMLGISRKGIHAITMPGMGTGARTKSNADRLMEALGVSASEIPIGPAVKQHFADIGQPEDRHDVTYENSQARERTQILMDYANKVNGIVLGTGDLSEEALGFCTYNGDHMSMYNVNCTVTKTCLRSLTRYLSAHSFDAAVAAICQDVVDTPVSPELLPVTEGELNQRTEDILGDYALHDFFLYHFMDSGAEREKLQQLAEHAFHGVYDADKIAAQLKTFLWRFYTQQFKRNCSPDGPKVGPVSLSPRGDWRMPSDMKPLG